MHRRNVQLPPSSYTKLWRRPALPSRLFCFTWLQPHSLQTFICSAPSEATISQQQHPRNNATPPVFPLKGYSPGRGQERIRQRAADAFRCLDSTYPPPYCSACQTSVSPALKGERAVKDYETPSWCKTRHVPPNIDMTRVPWVSLQYHLACAVAPCAAHQPRRSPWPCQRPSAILAL